MSERVTDPAYWISANGLDDPEMAGLVLTALVSPGDWGVVTVREEDGGKLITGPVSSLFITGDEAEMEFSLLLSDYAERPRATKLNGHRSI
jgi:hypothetical protein